MGESWLCRQRLWRGSRRLESLARALDLIRTDEPRDVMEIVVGAKEGDSTEAI